MLITMESVKTYSEFIQERHVKMAGETSKKFGELGEELCSKILDKLGWIKNTDNIDFKCIKESHVTDKKNPNITHGIDYVYSYSDPYSRKDIIILVDSKAQKITNNSKLIAAPTLGSKLADYIEEISKKMKCSVNGESFRELTGLSGAGADLVGIIFYYAHDEDLKEEFFVQIAQKSNPTLEGNDKVYVIPNSKMNLVYSTIKYLEQKSLIKCQDLKSYEFNYPDKEMIAPNISWGKVLTLDLMFSQIIFARVGNDSKGYDYFAFYSGEYTDESIKRLCSALSRYQYFHFDNVTIVPLSLGNRPDSHSVLERYFGNNELAVVGKTKMLKCEQADYINVKFSLPGRS